MLDFHLLCNEVKCRKELKNQAWVTICSHIFCMNDGQTAVEKGKCSACGTKFDNKYDIVVMDLNPNETHRTMILAGLDPEVVLDIVHRSLMFWVYQVHQDRVLREADTKNIKQYSDELTDYCETLIAKHKVELQKFTREIKTLQKELDEKTKHIAELIKELAEKSRIIKNLQVKYESFKRNYVPNYMQNNIDNYNSKSDENFEFTPKKHSPMPGINFKGDTRSDSKNSEQSQKKFVFQPYFASNKNDYKM